jgi:hypothetical protein
MKDFLNHIRQEKMETQQRRFALIKLKFLLIVGLFGVGNWKFSDPAENYLLLYLVPFIAFAIDLYVHGENFAIRRIGFFVREISDPICIERAWELFVDENRDRFTQIGINVVSGLVFAATLFILQFKENNSLRVDHHIFHYMWIAFNILVLFMFILLSIFGYRSLLKNKTPISVNKNTSCR